ncbi:MAG: M20 family metallo-hydrolase [Candidatus Bathyarchaeia archaeon]|jgi:succinyl-diaminopimelate desuccinylase
MEPSKVFSEIEKLKTDMTSVSMELIRIPAVAPENGGEGESKRAEKLIQVLNDVGFDKIERHDATDERVPSKKRPNIIAYYYGEKTAEKLWIVTHLDIVPPGEDSLWTVTKPFEPLIKDARVYGRGSEDNLQSMVASIFAVKALKNLKIKPKRTVALCFVADEEQGSAYGIQHLLKKRLFKDDDLVVVPDGGRGDGSFIEIAEKSILWLKMRTIGKQTHASRPEMGLNASRIGMQYALALDKILHKKYPAKDKSFDPPASTFEPTKRDRNVDAVNIVPGEDTNHFDCRILPRYNTEEVLNTMRNVAADFEKKTEAKIEIEVLQKAIAPKPTDSNARIVVMLKDAIRKTLKVRPKVGGIGGGTCAAFFREIDIPAVVWSTVDEVAHQPNEYSKIENLTGDAKVFARLALLQ